MTGLHWEEVLRALIRERVLETKSAHAEEILVHWHKERDRFWQVVPKEMLTRLEHPVTRAEPEKVLA